MSTEEVHAARAKILVTTCPSAFDSFKTDYLARGPDLGGIEVLHAAEYIDPLMEQVGRCSAQPCVRCRHIPRRHVPGAQARRV